MNVDKDSREGANIMQKIYGHIYMGNFIETGLTEKGAKIAAKRVIKDDPLYKDKDLIVGYRSPINNMFVRTASYCYCMKIWLKTVYSYGV